jgi:hypothetical protein
VWRVEGVERCGCQRREAGVGVTDTRRTRRREVVHREVERGAERGQRVLENLPC